MSETQERRRLIDTVDTICVTCYETLPTLEAA